VPLCLNGEICVLVQFEKWHGRLARDHAQDARVTSKQKGHGEPCPFVFQLVEF